MDALSSRIHVRVITWRKHFCFAAAHSNGHLKYYICQAGKKNKERARQNSIAIYGGVPAPILTPWLSNPFPNKRRQTKDCRNRAFWEQNPVIRTYIWRFPDQRPGLPGSAGLKNKTTDYGNIYSPSILAMAPPPKTTRVLPLWLSFFAIHLMMFGFWRL